MPILSKFIFLFCLFFILFLGILMVINNPQVVTISLLGFQYSLNLGVLVTVTFAAGVSLGLVALLIGVTASNIKLVMKEKELAKLKKED